MINFIFGVSITLNIIFILMMIIYFKFKKFKNKMNNKNNVSNVLNGVEDFFNDFFECNFESRDFIDDNK
jgi:ABC-type phosphate/phosphonate transport system permease subunit